ncbi:MAG: hypothetical protein ACI8V2_000318 [Candidatus Latescibacterota bacterium]|jgi:hypothetical protein
MKNVRIYIAILLGVCTFSVAQATEVKLGGGMIFEGSVPGAAVAVDIPIPERPFAISFSADYFKKSGHTTMPLAVRGLYKAPVSEKADFYLGAGGGLVYTKVDAHGAVPKVSSTKGLFSSVGGIDLKLSDSFGLFGEITFDRALTSGAKNEIAAKGGIFFSLGSHGGH